MKAGWRLFSVLAALALFVASSSSQLNPQDCTSTRTNSTCEYFVCGDNCSVFAVPDGALTYTTVDLAIQAVADESRGSFFNRIYLMPSTAYTADFLNISAVALEIRSFTRSTATQDKASLAVNGNMMQLSDSLSLVDISLSSSSQALSAACIDTTGFQGSTLTSSSVQFGCTVKLEGEGNFAFENDTSFTSSLRVNIFNSTLNLTKVKVHDTSFTIGSSSLLAIQRLEATSDITISLASAKLSIYNTSLTTPFHIYSTTNDGLEDSPQILVKNSCFRGGFQLMGLYWNASISYNCFYAVEKYVFSQQGTEEFESYAHFSPSALISATCNASLRLTSNYFWNGTLFIDLPYSDMTKQRCGKVVSNPYSWIKVQKNRFQPFIFQKSIYGKYLSDSAAVLPAVTVMSPSSPFSPNNRGTTPQHLNFDRNWWGHATGPYLCCNRAGKGGFVTPFANTSNWCLDADCVASSKTLIPETCFLHGCPQPLYSGFMPLTFTFTGLGLLVSVVAIIVAMIIYRRHLAPDLVQYIDSEELIVRSFRVFTIGSVASTFANITVIVAMALCIEASVSTVFAPLQQAVTFATFWLFIGYLVLASIQTVYTIVLWTLLFLRRQVTISRVAPFLRMYWAWNCMALCFVVTSTFSWTPVLHHTARASSDDEPMVKGDAIWLLSSDHNLFLLIGIIVSFFGLLASMVPARFIHKIVCYPEYSKMSTTLEVSLMRHVIKIPRVVRLSKFTANLTYAALPVGIATLILELALLGKPSLFYDVASMASSTFMPAGLLRIRLGLGSFFMIIGIITVGACLWATKVVRKVGVYSMISLLLVISFASIGSTLSIFGGNTRMNFSWAIPLMILNGLWLLMIVTLFLLIRSIRSSALKELPKYARDGINDHADEHWHSPTIHRRSVVETTPLLVSIDGPSNDESPLSGSDLPSSM